MQVRVLQLSSPISFSKSSPLSSSFVIGSSIGFFAASVGGDCRCGHPRGPRVRAAASPSLRRLHSSRPALPASSSGFQQSQASRFKPNRHRTARLQRYRRKHLQLPLKLGLHSNFLKLGIP
jgi:hypothetical protein